MQLFYISNVSKMCLNLCFQDQGIPLTLKNIGLDIFC